MITSKTPQSFFFSKKIKLNRSRNSTIKWVNGSMNFYIKNFRLLLKCIVTFISIAIIAFIGTLLMNPENFHKIPINNNKVKASPANNSFLTSNTRLATSFNLVASQKKQQSEQNLNKNDSKFKNNIDSSIVKKEYIKETTLEDAPNNAINCQSTTSLCQGVLPYDLIDSYEKWNLTTIEYQHFENLLKSNCSNRIAEFVCQNLEPECRSGKDKYLKPCRRVCKGIFEVCSHIIASSEVLNELFDCNRYIDSNDGSKCEDITKLQNCFDDEFQCGDDFSCIPMKWRCDNIRDCTNGDDEMECKFCNYDEFKCLSDQECISEKWFCDGNKDCSDGSDESNCDLIKTVKLNDFYEISIDFYEDSDYNDQVDKFVSTGDEMVPIFVHPNSTTSLIASNKTRNLGSPSEKFRSAMRKMTKTTSLPSTSPGGSKQLVENSTSIKKRVTSSYSTSHNSPCPENYLRCVDGLCITLDQICDKVQDCSDNSDELHCE